MMGTRRTGLVAVTLLAAAVLPITEAFVGVHHHKHQHQQQNRRVRIHPGETRPEWLRPLRSRPGDKDPFLSSSLWPSSSPGSGRTPSAGTIKKPNLKPFSRFLEVECWKQRELRDLEPVLLAVSDACKQINRIVQRAQTDDLYGVAVDVNGKPLTDTNIQGEVQQKLDVVCNTIMLRAFCASSGAICTVASEEEDTLRTCAEVMGNDHNSDDGKGEDPKPQSSMMGVGGKYVAVFDPIDGSKNIDASLPVGSIFGIYEKSAYENMAPMSTTADGRSEPLPQGAGLVAAGYCLFSATTVLVLTMGSGVDGFTLDPDKGTFLHTHPDIRIPSNGPIYSFNEANFRDFDEPIRRYLTSLKDGDNPSRKRLQARYVGALVADVHNILINGGIYGYPATRPNPDGKLRLLYECNPMAMIMEQAGGAASTGEGRILDVKLTEPHQRAPTFLGSLENVFELDQFILMYSD